MDLWTPLLWMPRRQGPASLVPQVEQQPVQGQPAGPATRHRLLELEPRRRLRRLQEPRRLLLRELDPVHGEHSWLSVPQVEQEPVQGQPAGPATRQRLRELEPRRRLRRLQEPRRLLLREVEA